MAVSPLSAQSAERLEQVLTAATDAVETQDTLPDIAISKAAMEHGLPLQHVPIAVRAYNNGRTARQLVVSQDPWERASNFKMASVQGVLACLTKDAEGEKRANVDDYALVRERPVPKAPTLTGWRNCLALPEEPVTEKRAEEIKDPGVVFGDVLRLFRTTMQKIASIATELNPRQLVAVHKLAHKQYPAAAKIVFDLLAARDVQVKAASADVTVSYDHPMLALISVVDRLRQMTIDPRTCPRATQKAASGFTLKRPDFTTAGAGVKSSNIFGAVANPLISGTSAVVKSLGVSPFEKGLGETISGQAKHMQSLVNAATASRQQAVNDLLANRFKQEFEIGSESKLQGQLQGLQQQEMINSLLRDDRLKHVQPHEIVRNYNTLASLAPGVMSNPAVASDFIHRIVQTGPLSYHDLAQLTKMEKDYRASRRGDDYED